MEEAKLTVIKWVFVGPPLSLLALLLTYELKKEEVILCNNFRLFFQFIICGVKNILFFHFISHQNGLWLVL